MGGEVAEGCDLEEEVLLTGFEGVVFDLLADILDLVELGGVLIGKMMMLRDIRPEFVAEDMISWLLLVSLSNIEPSCRCYKVNPAIW